jgi:hypothetical protein
MLCFHGLVATSQAVVPPRGMILDDTYFNDTDSDGLDDNPQYVSDEPQDFASHECDQWTAGGEQFFKITQDANNNGDCGMYREWWWDPVGGESFRAKARVNAQNFSTPFGARITISFWRGWETDMLKECSNRISASSLTGSTPVEISKDCTLPKTITNADVVKVHIRANNGCAGCSDNGAGYGTIKVSKFTFERI